MNKAALSGVYGYLFQSVFTSFGYIPRSGIAGLHGDSVFKFLRNSYMFSTVHHLTSSGAMHKIPVS